MTRALAAAVLVLCAAPALGAKPIVAISPMRGPQVAVVEQAITRALKNKAIVLSSARFAMVAKGVFAETQAPEDLAAVAREMGAQWIVTATVKAEGARWSLSVSLRDGFDGQARSRLRYPLTSPRTSIGVLRTLSVEIVDALAAAVRAPRRKPRVDPGPVGTDTPTTPDGPRRPTGKPPVGDDEETPPSRPGETSKRTPRPDPVPVEPPPKPVEPVAQPTEPDPTPPPPKPATTPGGRPRWARWFELGIGPSLSGRNFSLDPPPPRFTSSVVGGVAGDFTLYPLAFTWKRAYGLFSGLGLGIRLDKPIWPDSTARSDPSQRFPTAELRVEGGLRWKFTLYKPMPRPQLHLIVEGGLHEFGFAKAADGTNVVGVPDVRYVYASVGAGLTVHFAEWSWIWLKFVYHAVTDVGSIQSVDQYGLAAAYGVRFTAGLDFLVYKGLRLGVSGMYERFAMRFGFSDRAKVADGGTDEYYGGMLLLGYVL